MADDFLAPTDRYIFGEVGENSESEWKYQVASVVDMDEDILGITYHYLITINHHYITINHH